MLGIPLTKPILWQIINAGSQTPIRGTPPFRRQLWQKPRFVVVLHTARGPRLTSVLAARSRCVRQFLCPSSDDAQLPIQIATFISPAISPTIGNRCS